MTAPALGDELRVNQISNARVSAPVMVGRCSVDLCARVEVMTVSSLGLLRLVALGLPCRLSWRSRTLTLNAAGKHLHQRSTLTRDAVK